MDGMKESEDELKREIADLVSMKEQRKRKSGIDFYVPNEKQLEAHKSLAKTVIFSGGNRSGKSHFGAAELVMHLAKKYPDWYPREKRFNRPVRCVISATSFAVVGRVIEPKLLVLLPKDSFRVRHSALNYLMFLRMMDGSTVDILTLEMEDSAYESANWDFAWLDEPQHRRKWVALKRGLVDTGGRALITMTPLTQPWMKEELVDREDGKRIAVFRADIRDNLKDVEGTPILTEENIKEFEETIPEEYKDARLHGYFFHMQGLVYMMFSDVHIKDFEYNGADPVICVLDPHDRLPHHVIWASIDRDDVLWVDSELSIHCELPELGAAILAHEKNFKYRMKRRLIDPNFGRKPAASGSNKTVIQELGRVGVSFGEPCDDIELGHMMVRDYLNYKMAEPVTAVNSPHLFFNRLNAPITIRSMRNLQYEEWQGKTKEDKNPKEAEKDKDNHGADTVRYLCIERPRYPTSRGGDYELSQNPY